MKRIKKTVMKVFAKFTYQTAQQGAGLASILTLHQPKVPKKLAK